MVGEPYCTASRIVVVVDVLEEQGAELNRDFYRLNTSFHFPCIIYSLSSYLVNQRSMSILSIVAQLTQSSGSSNYLNSNLYLFNRCMRCMR